MKAHFTEIFNEAQTQITVVEKNEPYYNSPFHYHPEFELAYVKEGFGKRIIADKIESFYAGDLVFLGPNLPHVWQNDEIFHKGFANFRSKFVVIHFQKEIFSDRLLQLQESSKLTDLFAQSARGIKIVGKSQEVITEKMSHLNSKKGLERLIGLLDILHIISVSKETEFISHKGYSGMLGQNKVDRLAEVYNYVSEHYNKEITLDDVARMTNLTPPAFCRLFKKRTNRHFVSYLNDVRISRACKQLLETDLNISEIAFHSGYKTVSNFNKIFKKNIGIAPKAYREKATAISRAPASRAVS